MIDKNWFWNEHKWPGIPCLSRFVFETAQSQVYNMTRCTNESLSAFLAANKTTYFAPRIIMCEDPSQVALRSNVSDGTAILLFPTKGVPYEPIVELSRLAEYANGYLRLRFHDKDGFRWVQREIDLPYAALTKTERKLRQYRGELLILDLSMRTRQFSAFSPEKRARKEAYRERLVRRIEDCEKDYAERSS